MLLQTDTMVSARGTLHNKYIRYMDKEKRIQWIDWAKVLGIMVVVFCHVPQYDTGLKCYLSQVQMPLFFLLSGYLHKVQPSLRNALHKYWWSLVVPYLLFQVIFYPYWLVKEVFMGDTPCQVWDALLQPILGCLMGNVLDGPTWFLPALLVLKLLADALLSPHRPRYVLALVVSGFVLVSGYLWHDEVLNISFTWDSMTNYAPFFFAGCLLRREKEATSVRRMLPDASYVNCIAWFLLSLCLLLLPQVNYLVERIVFYAFGLTGTFFFLQLCKLLGRCPSWVVTLSKGTIVILGLHWMCIGTVNFLWERYLQLHGGILYTSPQALVLVLLITLLCYLVILFCQKHFRLLLGGR